MRPLPRRIIPTLLIALLAGPVLVSCSAGDEPPVEEEQRVEADRLQSGRIAHLAVTSRDALGRDSVPAGVSAQFVDFSGVDVRTVRRSLGLWMPNPDRSGDECWLEEEPPPIDPEDWYASDIELMHAGTVVVDAPERRLELSPRPMPELLPYLSGFTYGTDTHQQFDYRAGMPLEIWSVGGHQVGDFDVALEMPDPIAITYVGGTAVGSASSIDVDLDEDLLVLWEPTTNADEVYLVIEEDGIDWLGTLSCTAYDDGAFLLSREALRALIPEPGRSRVRLTLRRATVEPLELGGFDQAEAVAVTEHSVVLF